MGRDKEEGDLWDDSALINAFDHAIYHYKKMHGLNERRQVDIHTSIDGKAKPEAAMDTTPISKDDADQETVGDIMREQNGSSNFTVFDTALELGESRTIESVEDYKAADLVGTESFVEASNVQQHTQVDNSCPCPSGNIEYEKLLKQYYELEEKRQAILQQLQQFGAYGFQYPAEEGSGFETRWAACSASAYHSVLASQAPPTSCVFSCCSHACCCSVAPCHFSACSIGGTCIDKGCAETCAPAVAGKSSQGLDNDVLRTAVEAVDKAINSTMTKNSGDSMEENRVKENGNDAEGETVQCIGSGTDLSVVLNAWYSAGLYTGKSSVQSELRAPSNFSSKQCKL